MQWNAFIWCGLEKTKFFFYLLHNRNKTQKKTWLIPNSWQYYHSESDRIEEALHCFKTRIMKGDGTHESTWPILESLLLHPPALEYWSCWNSWKYLDNPWELMVTSSCNIIMKDDGTHESTWPILESLWLHPPALELWRVMDLMKAPGQS